MMTVGNNKPDKNKTGIPGIERSLRDDAEEQIARSPKFPPDLEGQTPDQLIHELRVHQIELETQADELRRAHLELTEARDKYLDLYEFAPIGYFTLNEKAVITHLNLSGAKLLGVERGKLINHGLGQFIDPIDRDLWDQYFAGVRGPGEKKTCTLMLLRKDGVTFPARLEGVRTTGSDGAITIRIAISDITDMRDAGEAVADSEKQFRLLFNSGRDAIAVHKMGKDGQPTNFIQVNDIACERLGYTREEMFKLSPRDIDAPDCSAQMPAIIDTLLTTNHVLFETVQIAKDGHRIPVEVSTVLFQLGDEKATMSVARDITGRKRVEESLRVSEDRFRQLFTRMPSAVAIYEGVDGGEDFIIKDFNAAAEKIEEIKKDDIIGKRVTQVFPGVRDFGIFAVFQRVWRTGQAEFFPSALYRDERDPGTWRENWVYKLENGEVIAIYHDITERKHAEEALRASEMKYRDIFEKSVSGLFKTSMDGHLIDTNDALAHMYGYSDAAEMLKADPDIGTHFYANPDDRKEVLRILAEKGMVENHEILHCKRDGTHFWGLITARIVRNEDGSVLFIEGLNTDISERKCMEEALRQANKKLNLLSSITRHDITNQLMSANGFLELLHRKVPDPTLEDYFTRVIKANSRISAIIQFTREYEQIGIKAPVWQDCRILADTAAKQAPLGKVTVKNDLPAGMEVFADPLIMKVFYNLMDNAARYGGKIMTIRFFVLEHGDGQIIVCEDDGEGIPADEKDKIFERGFGKNTGMGLFLSREILSITGITIKETGEPGKGARFELVVPKGMYRSRGTGGTLPG